MHYLTLRLILCIIFFSISTIVLFSEYPTNKDVSPFYRDRYFAENMFNFNLGDYLFSWIEQMIFIFGGILGWCATRDILKYKGEKTDVGA